MLEKLKIEKLRNYLRLGGLKVTGKKVELVARVFAATENNVQSVKTAVEIETELEVEYMAKVNFYEGTIPNPFKISHG